MSGPVGVDGRGYDQRMGTPFDDLHVINSRYNYNQSDEHAFAMGDCSACGAHQFAVVGYTADTAGIWLRCLNCKRGYVQNSGVVSPPMLPLRVPAGVSGVELEVWNEARECLGVGAYTAAVMLCRKLLMHIAVANGLSPKSDRGFAPTFVQCVEHLETEGLITNRMRPWIDRIKDVGNEANHEVVSVSKEAAMDVGSFTQKLLELAYEMDDTMAKAQSS